MRFEASAFFRFLDEACQEPRRALLWSRSMEPYDDRPWQLVELLESVASPACVDALTVSTMAYQEGLLTFQELFSTFYSLCGKAFLAVVVDRMLDHPLYLLHSRIEAVMELCGVDGEIMRSLRIIVLFSNFGFFAHRTGMIAVAREMKHAGIRPSVVYATAFDALDVSAKRAVEGFLMSA